jgi:transcriptional regulator with XRE-family HTH domain
VPVPTGYFQPSTEGKKPQLPAINAISASQYSFPLNRDILIRISLLTIISGIKYCQALWYSYLVTHEKMAFRENLKAELVYQGMIVKELAKRTEISKHTLDNYLNVNNYMPSAENAVKIARALGVTVEYLVLGAGNPTGEQPRVDSKTQFQSLVSEMERLDSKKLLIVSNLVKDLKGL